MASQFNEWRRRLAIAAIATVVGSTAAAQSTDATAGDLPGLQTNGEPAAPGDDTSQPRANSGDARINRQARRQARGDYDTVGPTKPAGLFQEAWNQPLRNKGTNQRAPGYVRYDYAIDNVYPVVVREGMITTIRFPEDENIIRSYPGDAEAFDADAPAPNIIAIRARYPGVDTSFTAYGASGRIYSFYLRAVGVNARHTTDFVVDVVGRTTRPDGFSPGSPAGMGQTAAGGRAGLAGMADGGPAQDYLDRMPFRPWEVTNDLEVFVPKGAVSGILPRAVFRDKQFTYVDYGENASQMVEWPVASLVVQGVETPVGYRTAGPGGRMIVVEAVGDIMLRNGTSLVAIRMLSKQPARQVASRAPMMQEVADPFVPRSAHLPFANAATVAPASPSQTRYRLDLGSGEKKGLGELWKVLRGENADLLGRLDARVMTIGGEARLKSSDVASLDEGLRICQGLTSRGRPCAVDRAP